MSQHTFYKLMKQLSNPAKVASTLDWKRFSGSTLLSLNIHRNRIGIAVATHPSMGSKCVELEPLRFAADHITIDKDCVERFQNIIEEYKVCGIVVSWPLQHDTGRMGAACGRVLYALEEIIDKSSGNSSNNVMMSPNRPLCLWDSGHIIHQQRANPLKHVDSFGRCAQYGVTATTCKNEYRASVEQYHEDELTVVQQVWNDFCEAHWPDLVAKASETTELEAKSDVSSAQVELDAAAAPASSSSSTSSSTAYYAKKPTTKRKSLIQSAR